MTINLAREGSFGPILWCIALSPTSNENTIDYCNGKIYNMLNAKDLDLLNNFTINIFIRTKRTYLYSITSDLKLALDTQPIGIWHCDNKCESYFGDPDVIRSFAIRKLLYNKQYLVLFTKKMTLNLKYVDNYPRGIYILYNIAEFFETILKDGVLTLTINKSPLWNDLLKFLLTAIIKYKHHKTIRRLIDLFVYNLIFTSKNQRQNLRKIMNVSSICRCVLLSGTCFIYSLILYIYFILGANK